MEEPEPADEKKAPDYSPLLKVTAQTAPTLLIHGYKDELVPLEHSTKMIAALEKAQVASKLTLRVDGHSHSPLFGDEAREIAVLLKKSNAIDNSMFVRMMNPPSRDNILHALRQQQKQQSQMIQQHPELLQQLAKGGRKK